MQSALPQKKLRSCFFYLLVLKTDRPVVRYQQISGLKGWSWGFWLSAIDENKEALWGGVQLLFFRSQTDLINKSNSLAIQAMAVCRREVFTILCKIYAYIPFHDPISYNISPEHQPHYVHTFSSNSYSFFLRLWASTLINETHLDLLRVLCPTWLIIGLVIILRVSEGEGWVLATGHSWASAGLYPSSSGPQLDGPLWRQRPLGVWVGVRASAKGVTPLE